MIELYPAHAILPTAMHSIAPPLISAGVFDLLWSLMGLLVLVMWVIRQIVEANKQAGPPKGRPQPAPQPPQPQGQPQPARAAQPAGQQADPLRNQVEEFLRRAGRAAPGDREGPAQRRVRPAGGNEIEVLIDEPAAMSERRPLAEPFRPMEQQAPTAPPPPVTGQRKARPSRQPVSPRRETVAEHVAESVAAHTRAIGEQSSRLGQRIIQEDQQFDAQLKAKFDHSVGTLTGSNIAAEEVAAMSQGGSQVALQLAEMLASPDGMRQAIVLNEILRRPSERW
jgi:hypothetical protein